MSYGADLVLDRWLVTFPTPILIHYFENRALWLNGARFQASHGRGGHIRLKAASWSTPRSPVSLDKGCNSILEGGKEGGCDEAQRPGKRKKKGGGSHIVLRIDTERENKSRGRRKRN